MQHYAARASDPRGRQTSGATGAQYTVEECIQFARQFPNFHTPPGALRTAVMYKGEHATMLRTNGAKFNAFQEALQWTASWAGIGASGVGEEPYAAYLERIDYAAAYARWSTVDKPDSSG